jgi:hypothetical protein
MVKKRLTYHICRSQKSATCTAVSLFFGGFGSIETDLGSPYFFPTLILPPFFSLSLLLFSPSLSLPFFLSPLLTFLLYLFSSLSFSFSLPLSVSIVPSKVPS